LGGTPMKKRRKKKKIYKLRLPPRKDLLHGP
jgi:hypothetical protein